MRTDGFADRASLAGLVLGQGVRRLRRGLAAPLRLASVWRAPAPDRLVIAPQDLRTSDLTIAEDIYGGYYVFHGKAVNTHGESPFLIEPPSLDWAQALYGFGWLRHLRAADTMLARANARALTQDWMDAQDTPPAGDPAGRQAMEAGWSVETAARRVLSWISQSPLILDGADRAFYRRFMKSLARHCAWLSNALAGGVQGNPRLLAAIAVAQFALCADVTQGRRRRAVKLLDQELSRQILPDGGHISRSPRLIVETLLDLLPLRQAFSARGVPPPQSLVNAIDRMTPMLRLLRNEDGSLARFNGMGATRPDLLATLLAYEDASAGALTRGLQSGYMRLIAGDVSLIADVGAPPPRAFSSEAGAGALSFELTVSGEPLIVNCGAPERWRSELREAARQTAAHSTLVIDDVSSARFAATRALSSWLDGQIISGPRRITLEQERDAQAAQATHDGYVRRFGFRHRRSWRVERDAVEGEDALEPGGKGRPREAPPFGIRFHLHPSVRTQPGPDGGVLLVPPSGDVWEMTSDAPLSIEESVFFATPEGARATSQIIIDRPAGPPGPVRWRLGRARRPSA